MNNRKYVSLCLAMLFFCGILSGCGSRMNHTASNHTASFGGQTGEYNYGFDESVSNQDISPEIGKTGMAVTVTDSSRKLVREVSMELQSRSFETLTETIQRKIASVGGYSESSELQSYQEDRRSYYILARIPAAELDRFLEEVEKATGEAGSVVSRRESVTDITLNYVDTESRKKSLLVEQERLLELIQQAEGISDIIALEERLSEVQYQLESYESQIRVYDNQVDYASVSLRISEVERVSEASDGSLFDRMRTGLADTFYNIGQGAQNFAVWAVSNLPYLLFAAAVIVVAVILCRRQWKKGRKTPSAPTIPPQAKIDGQDK